MEVTANSVPTKVEANNGSDRPSKKNGKEEKSRRKDDKSVEQVMKALNVLDTTEEKLAAMCKKYTEIVDENRKLQLSAKQWEKGLHAVLREKEQLQADHSKAVLTRSRLESLCRELQRQNKQIKEESLLKIREEEEKRKEVSAKFNATLAEITALMTSSNEKTNLLRDENVEITKKFKSICDQNAIQQQQVDKMNTQRKLESELTEARLAKQRLEFAAEKEILLKEKQELYMDIHTLHARVNELEASEASLKGQVSLYADRYDEFQTALTKSNEVFGGFKGEMEKMSKKITRLEKETSTWKTRWEKSHQSFLEVVAEKSKCEGELALASRKHAQLEKLCRTLQTERVLLLSQIKGLSLSPATSDGTDVAASGSCEDLQGEAIDQQTFCKAVQEPVLASDERNYEITATLESLSLQSSNSNNSEKPIDHTPDVIKVALTPSDNTANAEESPNEPSGDKSNTVDDVNALTVDKAPADNVGGESNAVNTTHVGKPAADKPGSKADTRAPNKKNVKPRPGAKEALGDKKKSLSASEVKKASCDAAKEKKDKDNVKVLSGSKNKAEVQSDKKTKGDDGDKKDQSAKEKKEIDSSNEKQKHGSETEDSNKMTELASNEKIDVSEATEKDGGKILVGKQDLIAVNDGSINTKLISDELNLNKVEIVDMKVTKESIVAVAAPVIEKKCPGQQGDAVGSAVKADVELSGQTGGESRDVSCEKQMVEVKTEDPAKKSDECKVKEKHVEKVFGAVHTDDPKATGIQPVVKEKSKVQGNDQVIANSGCIAKNGESKVGEGDKGWAEQTEVLTTTSTPSSIVNNQSTDTVKSDMNAAAIEGEDKVMMVSDTNVSAKTSAVESNKSAMAPNKDAKKSKKPDKSKKSEKSSVSAEGHGGKARPSLPMPSEEKKPLLVSAPSTPSSPAPGVLSPVRGAASIPNPVQASSQSSLPATASSPLPATTSSLPPATASPPPATASSPLPAAASSPLPVTASSPPPATASSPPPATASSPATDTASSPATDTASSSAPATASSPAPATVSPPPATASSPPPSTASSPPPATASPVPTSAAAPPFPSPAPHPVSSSSPASAPSAAPAPTPPGATPSTPEAASPPAQQPETGSPLKAGTSTFAANPGAKLQSDSKKEKVVAKKRKK